MNLAALHRSIAWVCLFGLGCSEVALVKIEPGTTTPSSPASTPPTESTAPDTTPPDTGTPGTPGTGDTDTTDTALPGVPAQLVLAPSRDAFVIENNPDLNYGDWIELTAGTWTASGVPYSVRSLVAFDLSALPVDATDVVAHLDLYAETTSRMYGQGVFNSELPGHSTLSAPNAFRLNRTLAPWDEATVTWNTQPGTDPAPSVGQPSSLAPDQDYLGIDVTPLVADALAAGATEASLLLHQEAETYYGEVTFATSDHTDPALHPRLTLEYLLPVTP